MTAAYNSASAFATLFMGRLTKLAVIREAAMVLTTSDEHELFGRVGVHRPHPGFSSSAGARGTTGNRKLQRRQGYHDRRCIQRALKRKSEYPTFSRKSTLVGRGFWLAPASVKNS
jgi:hypothetical protein